MNIERKVNMLGLLASIGIMMFIVCFVFGCACLSVYLEYKLNGQRRFKELVKDTINNMPKV